MTEGRDTKLKGSEFKSFLACSMQKRWQKAEIGKFFAFSQSGKISERYSYCLLALLMIKLGTHDWD